MRHSLVKRRFIIVFFTILLFGLILGGCSSGDTKSQGKASDGKPKDGGILKVGLSSNPKTLDPILYTGVYESQVMSSIADTLIKYNKDQSDFVPSLATDWKISDDMKEYTFTLRDDVKFQPGEYQDGRKMVPEDVKYSLERSAKKSVMNRLAGVDKVEVTGDNEVTIYLTKPNAALLAMLTDAGNVIVPKEEVEGWGDKFGAHLVGTGPFQLKNWQTDQQVDLVRHEKYWGERPHLDGVTFKIISDPSMMANALRSGDINIGNDIKGQNRKVIEKDPKLKLLSKPALSLTYLDLNNKKGPTKDSKVRKAIYMATDVKEMVKGANQYGGAEPSYMPLPKGSWGYSKKLEQLTPKYDPKEAKKLLSEAGYPDGFETEIYAAESRVPYATIFQNQMKENLNIDVSIKTVEWGTYSDTVSKGNAPMSIGGWSWYPDPYFFLNQLYHTNQIGSLGNGKGYSNKEVDKLLDKAQQDTAEQDERAKLYQEALKIILKDTPRIEIDVQDASAGIDDKVKGFDVSPDLAINIVTPEGTNVWLDE